MNKETDSTRFALIMKTLAINAGVEMSKDILSVYFEALKGFTIEQFEEGAKKVLLTWEYNRMPPLSILTKNITNDTQQVEDKTLVVATKIVSHLNTWGSSKYPDLSGDPITKHLMSTRWPYGKWASEVLESELKWFIKEFCAAYRAFSETDVPIQIEAAPEVKKLTDRMLKPMEKGK